jgi:SAM-dependent methyltransferase
MGLLTPHDKRYWLVLNSNSQRSGKIDTRCKFKVYMSSDVNSANKWEADYERKTDGWDLGEPTPVFKRLAQSGQLRPGRMIVLGAGRGHDAREFARHGFQVTAVDFASHAVREMQRLVDPAAPIAILQNDLFTLSQELDNSFDYLLEYTCFCAIDPRRRTDYADLVMRLLKPDGLYIDLAFPLDKRAGGPPFAVSVPEILTLFHDRGFNLKSREIPTDSVSQRRGAEELLIFQKAGSPL